LRTAASASRVAPHADGARALTRDVVPEAGPGSCESGLRPLFSDDIGVLARSFQPGS
jgi:hypothetical protein